MAKPKLITARASVNLPGLPAGTTAQVDPTHPRVAGLLRTGLLVDEEAPIIEEPAKKTIGGRGAVRPQEKVETPDGPDAARTARRSSARTTDGSTAKPEATG